MTVVLGFELDGDGQHVVDLGGGITATLTQAECNGVIVPSVKICRTNVPYGLGFYINAAGQDEMTAQMRFLDELHFVRDAIDALLTMEPEVVK